MEIQKSHWELNGDRLKVGVAITKIDQERRIVSGFATLNNLDRQGDIVLASASKEAFEKFAGNLREMHSNIAAGRVVAFREETFVDQNGELYEGIYVDAYVSKGAEPTWIKVLDGTLTGFSIGGMVTKQEPLIQDDGSVVNVISEYYLTELSLVDMPANQLANIFSVQKMDNGDLEVSGIAVDVETSDVFWCREDNIATIGKSECSSCGNNGENIGWIESNLSPTEKSDSVLNLAKSAGYINNAAKPAVNKEEGVEKNMADEIVNDSETVVEKAETVEEISEVEVEKSESDDTAEEVAKSEEATTEAAVEEEDESIDFRAELDALRAEVQSSFATIGEAVASLGKSLEGFAEKTKEDIASISESVSKSLSEAKETSETTVKALGEQIGELEKAVVSKKAASREPEVRKAEKADVFAGRFTANTLN